MIGLALKLLTSRVAGPIGAGLSVVLVLSLLASCVTLKARDREIGRLVTSEALARRSYETCKGNRLALEASLAAQGRAVEAVRLEGDRRKAQASKALEQAQKGRAGAETKAARLLSHQPAGVDACARTEAADRAVLEALR